MDINKFNRKYLKSLFNINNYINEKLTNINNYFVSSNKRFVFIITDINVILLDLINKKVYDKIELNLFNIKDILLVDFNNNLDIFLFGFINNKLNLIIIKKKNFIIKNYDSNDDYIIKEFDINSGINYKIFNLNNNFYLLKNNYSIFKLNFNNLCFEEIIVNNNDTLEIIKYLYYIDNNNICVLYNKSITIFNINNNYNILNYNYDTKINYLRYNNNNIIYLLTDDNKIHILNIDLINLKYKLEIYNIDTSISLIKLEIIYNKYKNEHNLLLVNNDKILIYNLNKDENILKDSIELDGTNNSISKLEYIEDYNIIIILNDNNINILELFGYIYYEKYWLNFQHLNKNFEYIEKEEEYDNNYENKNREEFLNIINIS